MKKKTPPPKDQPKKHHWFEHKPKAEPAPPPAPADEFLRQLDENLKQQQLDAQVADEKKTLEAVPKIPVGEFQPSPGTLAAARQQERVSHSFVQGAQGMIGRCAWCGRVQQNLVLVETVGGIERYKGVNCCGQRHDGQQIRSTRGVPA